MIETLRNEQNHSDHNYRIENEYDRSVGSNDFNPESKLIWSGYRPSDDVRHYKYFISGNMPAFVATLEKMAILFENLGLDDELRLEMEDLAEEVRTAIETYTASTITRLWQDLCLRDDRPDKHSGSAAEKSWPMRPISRVCWRLRGFVISRSTIRLYQNTRAFILSDDNPYYHEGTYASGIGDPHEHLS